MEYDPIHTQSADTVPNHWLRSMFTIPRVTPHTDAALAAAGLSADALSAPGTPIPRGAEAVVLDHLSDALDNPYIGAELSLEITPQSSSVVTYILFNSATLEDALRNLSRFLRVTRPRTRLSFESSAGGAALTLRDTDTTVSSHIQLMEYCCGLILKGMRVGTGRALSPERIVFGHGRRTGRDRLAEIFDCPVTLGGLETVLYYPADALPCPIREADPALLGHLTGYCELLLEQTPPETETLSKRIERILIRGMADGPPSLAKMSSWLGMSSRTLTRRLAEEDTRYRDLLARTRKRLARAFLADPSLTLAEVALLCGFSDQSSFTDAYKRWTGRTPNTDRRALTTG